MAVFFSSFLSYLLLMVIIIAVAGVAIFIGITMRKKKNQKKIPGTATKIIQEKTRPDQR